MMATSRTGAQHKDGRRPVTLGIDIGGTGLKASVLDPEGRKLVDRVRVRTTYPCPPRALVRSLDKLTFELPAWDRVSVGFPGIVRAGRILTAPNLSTVGGPGTKLDQRLVEKWAGFPLAAELEGRLGKPVRILNDADMHGLAVISGEGLEFVLTLGTGLGAALFMNGELAPHIELALLPFQGDETYQDRLGNATRRKIGNKAWSKRVQEAVDTFETLLQFDRLFVGGGNAKKLTVDLGHRVQLVDNKAGILGGLKVWEIDVI
jgi:polyphosphate glucokinase